VTLFARILLPALLALCPLAAKAASCSDTGGKYDAWKVEMAAEAQAEGVGKRGIDALMATSYSKATIGADRNQKSFKYTLQKFLQVRGADAIVSQGRSRKAKNPDFYANLEATYGDGLRQFHGRHQCRLGHRHPDL
jgi:membrane-bound lytic murein transglycosylase B